MWREFIQTAVYVEKASVNVKCTCKSIVMLTTKRSV